MDTVSWEFWRDSTEINQNFNSEIKWTSLAFFSKVNFKVYVKEGICIKETVPERVTGQEDLYGPLQLVNHQN